MGEWLSEICDIQGSEITLVLDQEYFDLTIMRAAHMDVVGVLDELDQEPPMIIGGCVFGDALVLGINVVEIDAGGHVDRPGKRAQLPLRDTMDLIGGP